MKITSSYGVELRKQNIPIRQTLDVYRSAVSYLVEIYAQVWEELESIPLTDIYTKVDGKRYSVIGEGIYEKELETGRISAGLKHTQAYTDNVYSGSGDYTTHMTESESYMYAQYVGTWKKLVYNVGLGASRNYLSQENSGSYNRWYFARR